MSDEVERLDFLSLFDWVNPSSDHRSGEISAKVDKLSFVSYPMINDCLDL